MKRAFQRLLCTLGRAADLGLGVAGGLVWALAAGLLGLHLRATLHFSLLWLAALGPVLTVILMIGGWRRPAYFGLFSAPLLSMGAGDGPQYTDDDIGWAGLLAILGLVVSVGLLAVGTLFHLHSLVALGTLGFAAYAVAAPGIHARGPGRPPASPGDAPGGSPGGPAANSGPSSPV